MNSISHQIDTQTKIERETKKQYDKRQDRGNT